MTLVYKPPVYKSRVSLRYLRKSPERLHSTLWRWHVFRLENWEWLANSVYMKIPDFTGRVSVAQRSEHWYVDSETLGLIPGWGSEIFRIYR